MLIRHDESDDYLKGNLNVRKLSSFLLFLSLLASCHIWQIDINLSAFVENSEYCLG